MRQRGIHTSVKQQRVSGYTRSLGIWLLFQLSHDGLNNRIGRADLCFSADLVDVKCRVV